jgi:hypothetical protein
MQYLLGLLILLAPSAGIFAGAAIYRSVRGLRRMKNNRLEFKRVMQLPS